MTQEKVKCPGCGDADIQFDTDNGEWILRGVQCSWGFHPQILFCPFCGFDLSGPSSWDELITLLRHSGPPREFTFDVDQVVCDDRDSSLPYADRKPYPQAVEVIKALKGAGHRIYFLTARYMNKFDGDQKRASEYGGHELRWWLQEHGIPFDGAYLGKPSSLVYVDDRACRVSSNRGTIDWLGSFSRVFRENLCPSTSSNATAATPSAT